MQYQVASDERTLSWVSAGGIPGGRTLAPSFHRFAHLSFSIFSTFFFHIQLISVFFTSSLPLPYRTLIRPPFLLYASSLFCLHECCCTTPQTNSFIFPFWGGVACWISAGPLGGKPCWAHANRVHTLGASLYIWLAPKWRVGISATWTASGRKSATRKEHRILRLNQGRRI